MKYVKMELNGTNGISKERKDSQSSEEKTNTLELRNAAGDGKSTTAISVVRSPIVLRPTYRLDTDLQEDNSKSTLCNNNGLQNVVRALKLLYI
jgi:hypothetical protein